MVAGTSLVSGEEVLLLPPPDGHHDAFVAFAEQSLLALVRAAPLVLASLAAGCLGAVSAPAVPVDAPPDGLAFERPAVTPEERAERVDVANRPVGPCVADIDGAS